LKIGGIDLSLISGLAEIGVAAVEVIPSLGIFRLSGSMLKLGKLPNSNPNNKLSSLFYSKLLNLKESSNNSSGCLK
jgi:hypothetical protein